MGNRGSETPKNDVAITDGLEISNCKCLTVTVKKLSEISYSAKQLKLFSSCSMSANTDVIVLQEPRLYLENDI